MNIEQLKKIIKECVKESVREELSLILGESNQLKPSIIDESIKSPVKTKPSFKDIVNDVVPPVENKVFKRYSSNEALNQILNETKALPSEGSMVSGMPDMNQTKSKTDDMLKTISQTNSETAGMLKNVFTKDYSSLLKAVDKKAKGGVSGGLVTIDES